jgi:large subunit ribosomal protein L13
MSTVSAKPHEVVREWFVIDAQDLVLGRVASRVATVLRGKHKPIYTPHVDTGDFVIVVNADKAVLTGRKLEQKEYYRYSGFFGGLHHRRADEVLAKDPERAWNQAVGGMLPKNRLGKAMLKKLKVYAGADHPHTAQQPKPFPEHI